MHPRARPGLFHGPPVPVLGADAAGNVGAEPPRGLPRIVLLAGLEPPEAELQAERDAKIQKLAQDPVELARRLFAAGVVAIDDPTSAAGIPHIDRQIDELIAERRRLTKQASKHESAPSTPPEPNSTPPSIEERFAELLRRHDDANRFHADATSFFIATAQYLC